ncbi:MAG: Uncharacterised protein [SAR116 cluster bacterium]|nr:MAG: Uncharacterised protein [SAR116 cluster bacterium]
MRGFQHPVQQCLEIVTGIDHIYPGAMGHDLVDRYFVQVQNR